MGEAKRRKQKDPTFGKFDIRLSIQESPRSKNFLVMMNNEIIADSTVHYAEALAIQSWLENELILNPIRKSQFDSHGVCKWITSSPRLDSYPESTAEFAVYDLASGEMSTLEMTITGDDIIKEIRRT